VVFSTLFTSDMIKLRMERWTFNSRTYWRDERVQHAEERVIKSSRGLLRVTGVRQTAQIDTGRICPANRIARAAAGCSIEQDALNVPKGYLSRYTLHRLTGCHPPRVYARQSSGASLRNAVAGAMRGHIKPVMVPFSRAITRPVVISPVIASRRRPVRAVSARADISFEMFALPTVLFHCFHIAPHCTTRDPRERYALSCEITHTEIWFIYKISYEIFEIYI